MVVQQFDRNVAVQGAKNGNTFMRPGYRKYRSIMMQIDIVSHGGTTPVFRLQSRAHNQATWEHLELLDISDGTTGTGIGNASGIYRAVAGTAAIRVRQTVGGTTDLLAEVLVGFDGFY